MRGKPGSHGPVTHGTVTGYNYFACRCEACQDARRTYYGNRPLAEYLADVTLKDPHGHAATYRRGCRCEDCRAWSATDRNRRRRLGRVRTHNANGYKNGCRCDVCREAIRVLRAQERAA